MNKQNPDKFVAGILIGLCLMLALGAGGKGAKHGVGTYQISTAQDNYVYILNTQTGRVWHIKNNGTEWLERGIASGFEEVYGAPTAIKRGPGSSNSQWEWPR